MAARRVLIVEDEAIVAMAMASMIRRLGLVVIGSAFSGPEAINMAEEFQPELVIMDVKLRGPMDGIAAAEAIRSQYAIPVLFITAFSADDLEARCGLLDGEVHIGKPFSEAALQAAICEVLQDELIPVSGGS